jgi:CHAT domain-containing protein
MFTPDDPSRSGIIVRTNGSAPEVLDVRELSALDLTRVRHVTLSACWSADHFILPGRWIVSLPETLVRAGAASVLGCLWVVSDEIGAAFMRRFYEHLDSCSRAEALQRAQLDCLGGRLGPRSDSSSPLYWAGYQLYGCPDRLHVHA